MALLSMPSNVPLPAEISTFFATVVQRVIDAPSADTIRPVHSILSGIGSKILEILSPSSLTRLQGQLIQIVFRLDKSNHDTNAFCLAVLARMTSAELSNDISSLESSFTSTNHSKDQPEPFEPARKLFADKNVSKILDFVFGRAIWACSQSVVATVDYRTEVLKLCQKTIEPTNKEVRQRWLLSKPSLSRKLNEYAVREELDAEVRCTVGISKAMFVGWSLIMLQAFDFIAAVHDPKPTPKEMDKAVNDLFRAHGEVYCSQMVVKNHIVSPEAT